MWWLHVFDSGVLSQLLLDFKPQLHLELLQLLNPSVMNGVLMWLIKNGVHQLSLPQLNGVQPQVKTGRRSAKNSEEEKMDDKMIIEICWKFFASLIAFLSISHIKNCYCHWKFCTFVNIFLSRVLGDRIKSRMETQRHLTERAIYRCFQSLTDANYWYFQREISRRLYILVKCWTDVSYAWLLPYTSYTLLYLNPLPCSVIRQNASDLSVITYEEDTNEPNWVHSGGRSTECLR